MDSRRNGKCENITFYVDDPIEDSDIVTKRYIDQYSFAPQLLTDSEGNFNMLGKRLKNVGKAIEDKDVCTKEFVRTVIMQLTKEIY